MPAQTAIHSTTQQFLDIYDITNDLLIMKDGAVSLVLTVNAINFGLFAEEEQDAVIYAYAGLLNSLNYPIQIVIRSQTKDVTAYLSLLKQQEDETPSQLKKDQIRRYREFVTELVRERNVLDKKFYVIIPANALEMGLLPPSTVIPGVKKIDVSTVERSVIIEKARNILEPKRDHLMSQFNRIGLMARQLTTQEIIQLFYMSYNPEASEGQQITDTSSYTSTLVSAQFQDAAANLRNVVASAGVTETPEPEASVPTPVVSPPTPPPQVQPPLQPPIEVAPVVEPAPVPAAPEVIAPPVVSPPVAPPPITEITLPPQVSVSITPPTAVPSASASQTTISSAPAANSAPTTTLPGMPPLAEL